MNNERNNKIEQILDECLDLILIEGLSVEDCLERYPGYEDELKPLLETADICENIRKEVPNAAFKTQARREFLEAVHQKAQGEKRSFFAGFMPRWATAVVSFCLVFILGGGSLILASSGSMPGQILYGVKLAVEQTALIFAFSDEGKVELNAKLATNRIDEILYLAESGDAQQIYGVKEDLQQHLDSINIISGSEKLPDNENMILTAPDTEGADREFGITSSGDDGDKADMPEEVQSGLESNIINDAEDNISRLMEAMRSAQGEVRDALADVLITSMNGYQSYINSLE